MPRRVPVPPSARRCAGQTRTTSRHSRLESASSIRRAQSRNASKSPDTHADGVRATSGVQQGQDNSKNRQ